MTGLSKGQGEGKETVRERIGYRKGQVEGEDGLRPLEGGRITRKCQDEEKEWIWMGGDRIVERTGPGRGQGKEQDRARERTGQGGGMVVDGRGHREGR